MSIFSRHLRWSKTKDTALVFLLTLTIIALIVWDVAIVTEEQSLYSIHRNGSKRLNLYATSLRNSLEKFRHLPYILAQDNRIRILLQYKNTPEKVNTHLEDLARNTKILIYVMDSGGTTIATSNWRTEGDLTGHNFSFRPYFKDAREGRSGSHYAVGSRTKVPGFYISYPVIHQGIFLGAVVVKVTLEDMQKTWKEGGETVFVSDAYEVLFLSSNKDWKYKSLSPLPVHTAKSLKEIKYGTNIETLDLHRNTRVNGNIFTLEGTPIVNGNIFTLGGTRYLEQSLQLPEYGWRIHFLTDLKAVSKTVNLAISLSVVTATTILLCLLFFRERRLKLISHQQAREAQVVKDINERLRQEINKHKLTYENLRNTQRELIQAGKLAALGRMSAAVVHELNQPVAAILTFVASCRVFVKRQQPKEVLENLDFICKLTERMAGITGQLKTFARKSSTKQNEFNLTEVVHNVLELFGPQFQAQEIYLKKNLLPNEKTIVLGDPLQLEQVINNLIHNALDSLKEVENKELFLSVEIDNKMVILKCQDSGKSISEEALDSLFEPFFTTKDIGEGLGLGLSIAHRIIEDMNGTITAENRKEGGACFTLVFPLIESTKSNPGMNI